MKKNGVRKTELLFYLEYRTSAGHSCRRQMVLQCKKSSYDTHSHRRNRAYDNYSKVSLKRLRPLTQFLDPNKKTFFPSFGYCHFRFFLHFFRAASIQVSLYPDLGVKMSAQKIGQRYTVLFA